MRRSLSLLSFAVLVLVTWGERGDASLRGSCPSTCPDQACTIMVAGVAKAGRCIAVGGGCYCKPDDGTQIQETECTASSGAAVPPAPATVTLTLSPRAGGAVTTIPDAFGGGLIQVPPFSGMVTVQLTPTGNPNIDTVTMTGGVSTAPSFILPNGMATGPNAWQFVSPGTTAGTLNRSTGEFRLTSRGQVTNSIFTASNPISISAEYFGTVNLMTGVATVDNTAFDTYPPGVIVPFVSNAVLFVIAAAVLGVGVYSLVHRGRA